MRHPCVRGRGHIGYCGRGVTRVASRGACCAAQLRVDVRRRAAPRHHRTPRDEHRRGCVVGFNAEPFPCNLPCQPAGAGARHEHSRAAPEPAQRSEDRSVRASPRSRARSAPVTCDVSDDLATAAVR
eukprot:7384729-Prymnesium_polylepis.1